MIRYENLFYLVSGMTSGFENDWIYLNIEKWEKNPKGTEVFVINEDWLINLQVDEPEKVANNSKGEAIPVECGDLEVETFIDMQTLDGVLLNLKKGGAGVGFDLLIKAINYYREYDDFLELI